MSSFKDQLQALPSVAGIVHSAMVLRDEFVKEWTFESFADVMGPKIKGTVLTYISIRINTAMERFNAHLPITVSS